MAPPEARPVIIKKTNTSNGGTKRLLRACGFRVQTPEAHRMFVDLLRDVTPGVEAGDRTHWIIQRQWNPGLVVHQTSTTTDKEHDGTSHRCRPPA